MKQDAHRKEDITIQVIPTQEYFRIILKELENNGQAYVRVTGSSMMPLLHHMRDRVEIKPGLKVRLGDIVLYDRQNGRYALHRVVRKKKDSFTMVGDNQWYIDDNLAYDQIVGVVTAVERNGKRIARGNGFLKLYSLILTTTAFPRIYLRKAIQKLLKPFRHSGNRGQEGACE